MEIVLDAKRDALPLLRDVDQMRTASGEMHPDLSSALAPPNEASAHA